MQFLPEENKSFQLTSKVTWSRWNEQGVRAVCSRDSSLSCQHSPCRSGKVCLARPAGPKSSL